MPVLREIEAVICALGFQPIIALDFDIPKEKTRDYTIRLMFQCRYAIFEMTIPNGRMVEYLRANGFNDMDILQVYMAMDGTRDLQKLSQS